MRGSSKSQPHETGTSKLPARTQNSQAQASYHVGLQLDSVPKYFDWDPRVVAVHPGTRQKQMQILFLRKHFKYRPQRSSEKNFKENEFTVKTHRKMQGTRHQKQELVETEASDSTLKLIRYRI